MKIQRMNMQKDIINIFTHDNIMYIEYIEKIIVRNNSNCNSKSYTYTSPIVMPRKVVELHKT